MFIEALKMSKFLKMFSLHRILIKFTSSLSKMKGLAISRRKHENSHGNSRELRVSTARVRVMNLPSIFVPLPLSTVAFTTEKTTSSTSPARTKMTQSRLYGKLPNLILEALTNLQRKDKFSLRPV